MAEEEQKPDWDRLEAMVAERARRDDLLLDDGAPDWVAVSVRAGLSRSYLHGVFDKHNKPKYHNLVKLAQSFSDDPSAWLEAGGFDPSGPPPEATTLERAVLALVRRYADGIGDERLVAEAVERGLRRYHRERRERGDEESR